MQVLGTAPGTGNAQTPVPAMQQRQTSPRVPGTVIPGDSDPGAGVPRTWSPQDMESPGHGVPRTWSPQDMESPGQAMQVLGNSGTGNARNASSRVPVTGLAHCLSLLLPLLLPLLCLPAVSPWCVPVMLPVVFYPSTNYASLAGFPGHGGLNFLVVGNFLPKLEDRV
jgi:hypothetical protein